MSTINFSDNYLDRIGGEAYLNIDYLKNSITENDIYDLLITDDIAYRLDLISQKFLGNSRLYYLIPLINNFRDLYDLEPGKIIKMIKTDFFNKFVNKYKKEIQGV